MKYKSDRQDWSCVIKTIEPILQMVDIIHDNSTVKGRVIRSLSNCDDAERFLQGKTSSNFRVIAILHSGTARSMEKSWQRKTHFLVEGSRLLRAYRQNGVLGFSWWRVCKDLSLKLYYGTVPVLFWSSGQQRVSSRKAVLAGPRVGGYAVEK